MQTLELILRNGQIIKIDNPKITLKELIIELNKDGIIKLKTKSADIAIKTEAVEGVIFDRGQEKQKKDNLKLGDVKRFTW